MKEISAAGTCPLCANSRSTLLVDGVQDFEYAAPGTFRWIACSECALIRIDPMPSAELLKIAYPSDYHGYVRPASPLTSWLIDLSVRKRAVELTSKKKAPAAVLDIGCSTGKLLEAIGRCGHFDLNGVEYNPEAAQTARNKGFHILSENFEDANFDDNSMDLIIMQHVLEHVYDPVATLAKVHRILRSGGIVVGELPNFKSWDAALFRRYWGGGHAPRHIWHFTPETLGAMLKKCGFAASAISFSLHTGHWALSIQNYLRRKKSGSDGLRSGRSAYYPLMLLATLPINLVQFLFRRTGVMRFEARKSA